MSVAELSETVSSDGIRRTTLVCIRVKPYQRRNESRRLNVAASASSNARSTVIGWWTVATSGSPVTLQPEQPVAERLVVVDDVELIAPAGEQPGGAQRERHRFRETAGPHRGDLEDVDRVPPLPQRRGPERVGLAIEVQARQLGERGTGVELGIGLAADHLDVVSQDGQLTRQVPDVDTLAAAVRLGPV